MTSVALINATAEAPALRRSSRAAALVMIAVSRCPPTSSTTSAMSPDSRTRTTVPESLFRPEIADSVGERAAEAA